MLTEDASTRTQKLAERSGDILWGCFAVVLVTRSLRSDPVDEVSVHPLGLNFPVTPERGPHSPPFVPCHLSQSLLSFL